MESVQSHLWMYPISFGYTERLLVQRNNFLLDLSRRD